MITCLIVWFSAIQTRANIQGALATIFEYDQPERLYAHLENLTRSFPNVATLINLGLTFEKRPIFCLKISKGKAPAGTIIAEFGAHAREWAAHAAATHVVHELLNNEVYEGLITNVTWYIIPLLNPDGFWYSKTKDRNWRKNRRPNVQDDKCPGVDVNRNFPVQWFGQKTTCIEDYGGSKPSTESETLAIEHLFTLIPGSKVDAYISVHTDAQCIVLPYAYTSERPPNYRRLYRVAEKMKTAMEKVAYPKYEIIQASQMYEVSGTVFDWAYDLKRVPLVYTLELPFSSKLHERFRAEGIELEVIAKQCLAGLETSAQEILNQRRIVSTSTIMRKLTIPMKPSFGNTVSSGWIVTVTALIICP